MKGTYMEAAEILVKMEVSHKSFKTIFYERISKHKPLETKQKRIFAIITNLLKERIKVREIIKTYFEGICGSRFKQMYLEIVCFESLFQKKNRQKLAMKLLKYLTGDLLKDENLVRKIYEMKDSNISHNLNQTDTSKSLRINTSMVSHL